MDNRSKNPLTAQRALSGSYALQQQQQSQRRAPLPSRLQNVRSASQPVPPPAHIILDPTANDVRNNLGLMGKQEQFCRSPEVIDLDEDEDVDDDYDDEEAEEDDESGEELDQPPAKRARTDKNTLDAAHETMPGSPLPQPPKLRAIANKTPLPKDLHAKRHQPARRAHGLEPPAIATKLPPPRGVADFSPWSGHHPEDVLNETAIKSGHFDKSSGANSWEGNSARPIIWSSLCQKNSIGLQALSHLYTHVMEKRLIMGKCTASSTFKPPPRVTVTDTKREAWLRDLANPDIPLRKQSRTIPHGIRGKLLMEQCLGKGISMPRAVWLAKCVGANELRAYRRKGMSGAAAAAGESKWIREWTTHVEQFLEGVIASCGQPEWQTKMDYAVKLATSFYSEHLLERDHYLDWLVSSFSASSTDKLPIWIILLQLYWKDITALVKRGRRLAEATLEVLHQLAQQATPVSKTLKLRLQKLVVVLAVTRRGCLILPRTWKKYKYLLMPGSSTMEASAATETPAHNILRRNQRLTQPLSKTSQNTRCALLQLYSALDCVQVNVDIGKLIATASSIISDSSALVHGLIDWAASLYRTGSSRTYLAASQISRLRLDGHDTDSAVLKYLQIKDETTIDITRVHSTVAELVRIDGFSPSRYLQWLMTSGILSSGTNTGLATGLLSALPIEALSQQLRNTRQMLMRRLLYNTDETAAMAKIQHDVVEAIFQPGRAFTELLPRLDILSSTARSGFERLALIKAKNWMELGLFNLQSFCHLRELMERSDNLPGLSDLIEIGLLTDDMIYLATVIDTLDLHAKCLAAMGRLPTLTSLAVERYRNLRQQQTLDRTLVLALKSLLNQFQTKTDWIQILENDLAICDQQSSMAVCSPASDNLVTMQASSLDSDDDIDAVFASGNTMDEQLMQRVFARITQRAGKSGPPAAHAPSRLCAWWNQLRAVDISGFEQLVRKFIRASLVDIGSVKAFSNILGTLVASTCIELKLVLTLAKEIGSTQASLMALTLTLSIPVANEALHDSENYRFSVQQERCQLDSTDLIAPLITAALEDPAFSQMTVATSELLRRYTANGNQHILRAIVAVEKPSASYVRNCYQVVAELVRLEKDSGSIPQRNVDARAIIKLADPLSVEYCAAALQFFSKTGQLNSSGDVNDLQAAILEAVASGNEIWPQLLEGAGTNVTTAIYQWSREKVLTWTSNLQYEDSAFDQGEIQRSLDVLDITHHASRGDDNCQMLSALTEKLKAIESRLPDAAVRGSHTTGIQKHMAHMAALNVTLHLTILYATSTGSDTEASKQHQANLLTALCNLILAPQLQRYPDTLEYIYDIAASLSDLLPDTSLATLTKSLPPIASKDPRIISILGDSTPSDGWLALVSSSGSNPQPSQQQRALLKQSSSSSSSASSVQGGSTGRLSPAVVTQKTPASLRVPQVQQQQQQQQQQQVQQQQQQRKLADMLGGIPPPFPDTSHTKTLPFPLRRWEIMSDATPTVGENDTSLSLGLFRARKV